MEVRPAREPSEVEAALALRERVFCGEQGVAVEADRDGLDPHALHLVAVEDGTVLGTLRLVFEGPVARLGRLAVEREARRRGIARALLAAADREARREGARSISLHAQVYALPLYAEAGYEPYGGRFVEEGIEHVAMEKRL